MSVKEIREAMGSQNALFGIRQTLKSKDKLENVFIAKDTRGETVDRLESMGVEFSVLKSKADIAKELNLGFESEVISVRKPIQKKK